MKIYKSKYGEIYQRDCLDVMKKMESNSIDTLITDPPAGIRFMNKEWDHHKGGRQQWVGYMAERFSEALRIIKPGGLAIVWALPRTAHWTATALEDAGWYIDTKIYHLFGGGWPKGTDISKGIDKHFGCEREKVENPLKEKQTPHKPGTIFNSQKTQEIIEPNPVHPLAQKWNGYRTQLKPMCEEWIVCRKPIDKNFATNALKYGVAGYNIDGCRVEMDLKNERRQNQEPAKIDITKTAGMHSGYNQKAPRYLARSIQEMFKKGRYPGNVIIDDAVAEDMDKSSGLLWSGKKKAGKRKEIKGTVYGKSKGKHNPFETSSGGASRYFIRCNFREVDFFYGGKVTTSEKNRGLEDMPEQNGYKGSPRRDKKKQGEIKTKCSHPTVKSLALMRHLCMISKSPDGGIVLDIFAGSFSTLIAAYQTDRKFIGIEMDGQYCKEGLARLKAVMEQKKIDFKE